MGSPDPRTLKDRVVLVTGASRGIGAAVAVRAAADGAAVALLAKTQLPNPKIAGTLAEVADAVERAGGRALALPCDVRDADAVASAIASVAETFGGIDVVVNNAGALDLRPTEKLPPKNLRRLLEVNVEGPFAVVQAALVHLRRSGNAHVVNVSPPLNMDPKWVGAHVGHTVGKYAESLLTLGWAEEFASVPIAVNSLWPATTIASTGMMVAMGEEAVRAQARSPQIMAEAVHALVTRPAAACSGHFYTDEEVLREEGRDDLSGYLLAAREEDLTPNFYLPSAPVPTVQEAAVVNSFDALSAREPELVKLRSAVRDFLEVDRAEFGWQPGVDSWLAGWDEGFSARLGTAGFVGLTIPQRYGGHGLGYLHRYVVTEELIAAGAPVAAHWTADRQVAPGLLTYGSEEQRERLLPKIVAGQLYSSIGMSEHGAGSDLAAVQTKAVRADGGWLLSGSKVWTSGAHLAHQVVVLARSSPADPEHRHAGFSQFLVPCDAEGVRIEPIILMSGAHHFNEVLLDQVFVPDADVLGEVGNGWHQVTSELSFERSGPERILSTGPLLFAAIRALSRGPEPDDRTAADIGDLLARLISLRQLSLSVARTLADGGDAANQAALVKDLGTRFEAESVGLIADLLEAVPPNSELATMLSTAWLHKPMFTLRGGTNEVLRGVIARGMGLR